MPRFDTQPAPDIHRRLRALVELLEFSHIDPERIHCIRSRGSTSQAYARIWELPRVWQNALRVEPQYIVEVLEEHFAGEPDEEQDKILIHELLHIPKTFSGALRNHRGHGEPINNRTVNKYYALYRKRLQERSPLQLAIPWE